MVSWTGWTRMIGVLGWVGLAMANTEAIVFDSSEWTALSSKVDNSKELLILGRESSHVLDLHRDKVATMYFYLSDQPPYSRLSQWLSTIDRTLGLAKLTARVSWPASTPTHFAFGLEPARLRLTASPSFVPFPSRAPVGSNATLAVPFSLLVEPAHFGFLPASCLPLIGTILAILVVLWVGHLPGRAVALIDQLADQVAKENEDTAGTKRR